MKKLLTLIIATFSVNVIAQQWCPPGATWHYELFAHEIGGTIKGSVELKYSDTATVNNKLCKVIKGRFWGIHYNMYVPSIPTTAVTWGNIYHTYEDSGVVYIASGQRFDTIVNYNAVPGDKWLTATGENCTFERRVLEVTDTAHLTINGHFLRTVEVSITPTYRNLFIEQIGNIQGFMYVKTGCHFDEYPDGEFTCYSDDSFPLYKRAGVTECYTTVSVEELNMKPMVRLFPNPNTGNFKLEVPAAAEISISGITGSRITRRILPVAGSYDINIEDVPAGIYFLEIRNDQGRACYKVNKL